MKKTSSIAIAAALASLVASAALADHDESFEDFRVDERDAEVYVEAGVTGSWQSDAPVRRVERCRYHNHDNCGVITYAEMKRLTELRRHIQRDQRDFLRDGRLTRRERRHLQSLQQRERAAFHRFTHNGC